MKHAGTAKTNPYLKTSKITPIIISLLRNKKYTRLLTSVKFGDYDSKEYELDICTWISHAMERLLIGSGRITDLKMLDLPAHLSVRANL